ncbi:DNA-binding transcriptional regulator, FadR family [Sediminibacillus albus]|uniref:DNA-binding transcriptional regulator, FadR family n=1 Tax=Sediminibacillus albus TaxID=407036 RepID=A0A1G9BU58_9BACI|nr:DNA-binding transcriptional regulator, FadR family [Sediminibacillus albus]
MPRLSLLGGIRIISMPEKKKVYEEVLNEIRNYIEKNGLSPGDRLPSERELTEHLRASRSSVREALRAIELLGLIETRRGEGTFLRMYQPYHTVELLSAFILQDPNTRQDIVFSKSIIEKEAAKLAFSHVTHKEIKELQNVLNNQKLDEKQAHYQFFLTIFQYAENFLLKKIWLLLNDFSYTIENVSYNKQFYQLLVHIYVEGQYEKIEELFSGLFRKGCLMQTDESSDIK